MQAFDIFLGLYLGLRVFILLLLWIYQIRAKRFKNSKATDADFKFEGISILTSLKGPTPHMAEGVLSYLRQDYPGPLELVIATKNPEEPLLGEAQALVAANPSRVEHQWITSVEAGQSVNPRTQKIKKAFEQAKHPWIFLTCVDTRFDSGTLKNMMLLTQNNPNHFATSFPVIDSAEDFSAKLEQLGLNIDVTMFFLTASLAPRFAIAYGGGLLFHRSLLEKSGGFDPIVPLLTDDITLAQAFAKAGGIGHLAVDPGYVRQHGHTFRSFWQRQVRWRMISRFFLSNLYFLSFFSCLMPAFWIYCLVSGSPALWIRGGLALLAQMIYGFLLQRGLGVSLYDSLQAWVLPIYDYFGFFATCKAITVNEITWGDQRLGLDSRGAVVRTKK